MRRFAPLLVVLSVAAVLLGLAVVGEGYPSSFYADERVNIQRSLYFGAVESLNPGYFNKPALSYYCGFAAYGMVYVVGRISGVFQGAEDFGIWSIDHEHVLLLVGRIVVAISGLFMLWSTWWLAKKFVSPYAAACAALIVALSPAWIGSSAVIKEDALSAAFFALALASIVETSRTRSWRDAARAGLWGGLSMAAKYYAVALIAPAIAMLAVVGLFPRAPGESRSFDRGARLLGVGAIFFLGGFFMGSPFNFIDPAFARDQVLPGLRSMMKLIGIGGWLAPKAAFFPQNPTLFVDPHRESIFSLMLHSVSVLASAATVGLGACLLGVAGCVVASFRRNASAIGLAVGTIGILAVVTAANRQHASPRHLLVLLPSIAVMGVIALEAGFAWLVARHPGFALREALCMPASILLVMLVPSMGGSLIAATLGIVGDGLARDPRLEAIKWIEKEIPRGSTVLSYNEGIPLQFSEARCDWALDAIPRANRVNMATHHRGYDALWKIRKLAAQRRSGHDLDLILFEAPWQGSEESAIESSKIGYNPLWMERMPTRPDTISPVERLTNTPRGVRTAAVMADWPIARWLRQDTAVQFLVILDVGDSNFDQPDRRAAYPTFAAFFDDLHRHYDCWQWTDPKARLSRTVRVYDLRSRASSREPLRREMFASN